MAETAKSLIAEFWKKTGVRKPRRGVVASYADYSIFLADKLTSVAFQNHLELFDEFASWLVDLATVLLFSGSLKREDYAYAHLASAICSLALSVRHAACSGHDVSAKILAPLSWGIFRCYGVGDLAAGFANRIPERRKARRLLAGSCSGSQGQEISPGLLVFRRARRWLVDGI